MKMLNWRLFRKMATYQILNFVVIAPLCKLLSNRCSRQSFVKEGKENLSHGAICQT